MGLRTPDNLVAVGMDSPESAILGYYAMLAVPSNYVERELFFRAWMKRGLDPDLIPHETRPIDAFKNACRSIETRRNREKFSDVGRVDVKVDIASEDSNVCTYQVTLAIRNPREGVVEHPKAIMLEFSKTTESIISSNFNEAGDAANAIAQAFPSWAEYQNYLTGLEQGVREHFQENYERVSSQKIRTTLWNLMRQAKAFNVRRKGGALYFVPADQRDTLLGLSEALQEVYGDEFDMHLIPCASDEYQKDLLQKHFQVNLSSELDKSLMEISERLKEGKGFRSDKMNSILRRVGEMRQLHARYKQMLSDDLSQVGHKLELLDQQVEVALSMGAD